MKLKKLKEELKQNLSEKDLAIALEYCLQNTSQDSEYYDDLVLAKSRNADVERNYKQGLIPYEKYSETGNKIRENTIKIISKLGENDIHPIFEREYVKNLQNENEKLKVEIERLEIAIKKSKYYDNEVDTKILNQLEGYWLEIINEQKDSDRIFSIGRFIYNESTLEFEYNGTNYFSDGRKYYEWKSIKLVADFSRNNLYYIYIIKGENQLHNERYGFGVISLRKNFENQWMMEKGYFLDAGDEKNPKHCRILGLASVVHDINEQMNTAYNLKKRNQHKKIIKDICGLFESNPNYFEKY